MSVVRFSKKYGYEIEVCIQENGNVVKMMPEYVEVNYRFRVVDIRNGLSRTIIPLERLVYLRATKIGVVKAKKSKAQAQASKGGGENAGQAKETS